MTKRWAHSLHEYRRPERGSVQQAPHAKATGLHADLDNVCTPKVVPRTDIRYWRLANLSGMISESSVSPGPIPPRCFPFY